MEQKQNHLRPIRSFVLRQGRMTQAQDQALERLFPVYGLALDNTVLDLTTVFSRVAPTILEIGFGHGEALIAMAQNNPDKNFIGIDVHKPGVGALLLLIEKLGLQNIRVFCADALEVLQHKIPDNSLEKILLFFADPWPKKRHHKRRIVSADFCQLVRKKLQIHGEFLLATDWENYAEHMMQIISQAEGLENNFGVGNFAPRAVERPITKFENRGQKLGHGVWDLRFSKIN